MLVLGICDTPKVLEVMNIVNIIITIIRIVVPILLLFSLTFKLIQAITKGNEDAIASIKKKAVPSIIAAALIFIVPVLVNLIIGVSFPNSDYSKCLIGISSEKIQELYVTKSEVLVSKAEETININDYIAAKNYIHNVKDSEKKESYEERLSIVKKIIDEMNKANSKSQFASSGLGKEIVPQEDLIEACTWTLNQEQVYIRLHTCTEEKLAYKNPNDLPGGATRTSTGQLRAKKAISFYEYSRGVFFGEISPRQNLDYRYTFVILYRTVFLRNTVHYAMKRHETYTPGIEIYYRAGSCAQNYKVSAKEEKYDSGLYKDVIDDAVENTKYLIVANEDGTVTNVGYHDDTITPIVDKASKNGTNYIDIIEKDIRNSNTRDSGGYKTARVYDCRNLIDSGIVKNPNGDAANTNDDDSDVNVNKNIIYLGDSRINAFKKIKEALGFDDKKETIYAKVSTGLDDDFRSHMKSAKSQLTQNSDKTYAVTANYGVNSISRYKGFCDTYDSFVKSMDKKNEFYIVSVNPFDESKIVKYKSINTNANVETFNNYMKSTCINQIKSNSPDAKVYYCDTYGSIPVEEWVSNGYIGNDGVHYTKEGSKYIYNQIKKCVASNER